MNYPDYKKYKGMPGIYRIINWETGDEYIGQTKDLYNRCWAHKMKYKDPKQNSKLYKTMRKYGIDKFEFIILQITYNEKQLFELEASYIKTYKPNLNTLAGGKNPPRPKTTIETIDKIRETNLTKIKLGTHKGKQPIKVKCIELDLEFNSIKEACTHFGKNPNQLANAKKSKTHKAFGYTWMFREGV